jgi:dihydroorotate dehydrogenase
VGELYTVDTDRPPIFVSAGVIKTKEQIRQFAQIPELSAQVIGSFSEHEWGGNDPSGTETIFWWDDKNQAAYNAVGLRNPGLKAARAYLPGSIREVKSAGQLAIVSITALRHEDPQKVLPRLAEWVLDMGADGVEIDGSCPNHGTILGEDVEAMQELTDSVRQRVGEDSYVAVKLPNLPEAVIEQYKGRAKLAADGIVLINAVRRQVPRDPATNEQYIKVNGGYAGQSGPAIRDIARSNLETWSMTNGGELRASGYQDYQLWSVGGVNNGYEIHDRRHYLGARMVGAAQALSPYRTQRPGEIIHRWTEEYDEALRASYISESS